MEQKTRYEAMLGKDNMTKDEQEEFKELENIKPEDPAQDEFEEAWNELDGKKKDPEPKKKEDPKKDQDKADEDKNKKDQSTDADVDLSKDLLNAAPADKSDKSDSTASETKLDLREGMLAKLEIELEQEKQRSASWDGRIKAAEKRAAEAEQKLKDAEAKGQSDSDNASPIEDDAKLSAFFKEYPDLEGPLKSVAERIATTIVDKRMAKVDELVNNQAAMQDTLSVDATDRHNASILEAHPDWKMIYDSGALKTWIEAQPGYLQPRLNEVVADGSAREIIEMFDSYKRASGKGTKQTSTSAELAEAKKKKAAAMEAVPASTGGPKEGKKKIAKDDFDGAWEDLDKKEKKQT
jgi:hypothetical protein